MSGAARGRLRVGAALSAAGVTLLAVALVAADPAAAAPGQPLPFVRLYDTKVVSPSPIAPEAIAKRAGWAAVAEGKVAHKFAGDAVFGNDKLAVVLRGKGAGAELYSRTGGTYKRRSLLALAAGATPAAGGASDAAASLVSLRIVENTAAAVTLEATYKTAAGAVVAGRFRLTTGIGIVEFRPGKGAGRLVVRDDIRHAVVPELFANDFVIGAEGREAGRVGIPAENMVLALTGAGEAIGVCVWPSVEQNADAVIIDAGGRRAIAACEIECGKDRPVWYGLLEGAGIWHGRAVTDADAGKETLLAWRPPFPAKWQATFTAPGGWAFSRQFLGLSEADEQRIARGEARPRSAPGPAAFLGVSHATMLLPADMRRAAPAAASGAPPRVPRLLLAYPIDRSGATSRREATPPLTFCPIDVMRNALGVGVCQYVLETEGLGSHAAVTPREAAKWIGRVFKGRRDGRQADEIKERLAAMTRHVRDVNGRVAQYVAAARELAKQCEAAAAAAPREAAAPIREMASRLSRAAVLVSPKRAQSAGASGGKAVAKAVAWADEAAKGIVALIGKPNGAQAFGAFEERLAEVEHLQSRELAQLRQEFRRVKQRCRDLAAAHAEAAPVLSKLRRQAEEVLRKKPDAESGGEGESR